MKVSVVLVGVNVAATLSVASQSAALAQESKPSSTASFLKSSLTEAIAPQPVQLVAKQGVLRPPGASKVSLSDPRSMATRKAMSESNRVKLRPFIANRKLPTKLEVALTPPQSATMDESNLPTTLNGGVSEYNPYYTSDGYESTNLTPRAKYAMRTQQRRSESHRIQEAAKMASSYQRAVAPRAVPGAAPAVPGQVGFPCAEMALKPFPGQMPPGNMHFAAPEPQRQNVPEAPLRAPNLSPQEQLEMNKLVDMACVQNGIDPKQVGANADSLYNRIGPPPFPLSLIPEPAMKDFLKGARSRKSVAATASGMPMGGGSGLPAAGFRSYSRGVSANGFNNYSRMPTSLPAIGSAAQQHHVHHKTQARPASHSISFQQEAPKPQVMMYPPYRSNVNFGS